MRSLNTEMRRSVRHRQIPSKSVTQSSKRTFASSRHHRSRLVTIWCLHTYYSPWQNHFKIIQPSRIHSVRDRRRYLPFHVKMKEQFGRSFVAIGLKTHRICSYQFYTVMWTLENLAECVSVWGVQMQGCEQHFALLIGNFLVKVCIVFLCLLSEFLSVWVHVHTWDIPSNLWTYTGWAHL